MGDHWVYDDIKEAIANGLIQSEASIKEEQIQPASLDLTVGNKIFVIDSNIGNLFRDANPKTVSERIKETDRVIQEIKFSEGVTLSRGFSYLVLLNEKIKMQKGRTIYFSPKSSLGRLFVNTRLIADYCPAFDEISACYTGEKLVSLWLYVQPLAFNVTINRGNRLGQIRFINLQGNAISSAEITKITKREPIFHRHVGGNKIVPENHVVSDGLVVHLNLTTRSPNGAIALEAKANPIPIDLNKKDFYRVQDYFTVISSKDEVHLRRGRYYLLSSKEVLKMPPNYAGVVRAYSSLGFAGPLHFAGFIDNGFTGDLVFEVRSDEISKRLRLFDGMPISKIDLYKTEVPSVLYGENNNNYQLQVGPKVAKYFRWP